LANTESNGRYQDFCRANNLPVHPARFPSGIPEYFIRFLSNEGETVLDPFAGSCVTGEVAESLRRNWICCEISEEYLRGAMARFVGVKPRIQHDAPKPYEIYPPCSLNGKSDASPLLSDGGRRRTTSKNTPASAKSSGGL
jgi:site-specific DNA-methyltransferase (cytosine-N4-specific)